MSKKDILKNIQETTPRSRSYFLYKNILQILVFIILIAVGIVLVGSFIKDIIDLITIYDKFGVIGPLIILESLWELLLLGILLGILDYLIYRKTDWPMVRNQRALFGSLILLILVGGFGLSIFAEAFLRPNINTMEGLPYRQNRREYLEKRIGQKGVYFGRVIEIDEDTVTLENHLGSKEFDLKKESNVREGDFVVIQIKDNKIQRIKKSPQPPHRQYIRK